MSICWLLLLLLERQSRRDSAARRGAVMLQWGQSAKAEGGNDGLGT